MTLLPAQAGVEVAEVFGVHVGELAFRDVGLEVEQFLAGFRRQVLVFQQLFDQGRVAAVAPAGTARSYVEQIVIGEGAPVIVVTLTLDPGGGGRRDQQFAPGQAAFPNAAVYLARCRQRLGLVGVAETVSKAMKLSRSRWGIPVSVWSVVGAILAASDVSLCRVFNALSDCWGTRIGEYGFHRRAC